MRILAFFAALITLTATAVSVVAAPNFNAASPIDFFTNVASRLLSSQLNVDLTRIEIYPTNQYTPAVHRLLQVAANIYDATTNNTAVMGADFPSVFRPTFDVVLDQNGLANVYINGYEQVASITGPSDAQFDLPVNAADLASTFGLGIFTNVNIYGVPWIIGAKKGFPNFNEFAMESAFQLSRKLQVTRTSTNLNMAPISSYQINQMFGLSVTNQLGVECWNSYTNNFNDPVVIYVTDVLPNVVLANDEGFSITTNFVISGFLQIPNATNSVWPGYNPAVNPLLAAASFQIPLNTSSVPVPPSIYRFNDGNPFLTTNLALPFETNVMVNGSAYPQPHWWLMTTNNLRVIVLDGTNIIDYVQLSGPNGSRDVTAEIQNEYDTGSQTGYNDLWDTNLAPDGSPFGPDSQMGISLGLYGLGSGPNAWSNTMRATEIYNEINGFRAFYHYAPLPGFSSYTNDIALDSMTNAMQAPYTSIATTVQHISWQANDPLVHYLASDLTGALGNIIDQNINWPANLGQLNDRYMPWGGNPEMNNYEDTNAFNLSLKDPLVWDSDDWNFPDGQMTNLDWIGQVHRGTPWQTIDLKSAQPDINTWTSWTGDLDATDAAAMSPAQDWRLASLVVSLLNTNDLRSLFYVNNPNPNAWLALFNGLSAFTNTAANQLNTIIISSNSPQASVMADAIESARMSQPGQFFTDVGDILSAPQLTEQSPFLNPAYTNGISDEAYEAIPNQLLPLLRADSIGSAGLANGQVCVQFTGYDNHAYAIEVSSNLMNWVNVNTNYPINGMFSFTNSMTLNPQFYRSVLLQ